jgi:hypothetical protein
MVHLVLEVEETAVGASEGLWMNGVAGSALVSCRDMVGVVASTAAREKGEFGRIRLK